MKNLKKLVIASFMLVIAFVAVVSSTYAWFTSSNDAKVNDITIGVVDGSKSLLIKKDGGNWGKSVNYNFVAGSLYTPVTIDTATANQIKFNELKTDDNLAAYYDAADQLMETSETDASAKEGYIKLDLYFQIEAAKDNLSGSKIKVDITNLHAYTTKTVTGEGESQQVSYSGTNAYAMSSFRMAFTDGKVVDKIAQGTRTSTGEGDTVGTYGLGNQFRANNAWMAIYAAPAAEHLYVGTDNQNQPLEYTGQVSKGPYVTAHEDAAYTLNTSDAAYAAANMVTIAEGSTDAPAFEYEITKFYSDAECQTEITNLANETVGYAHVVIFVWMEGWDGDCENVASGGFYQFGLKFVVE